MTLLRAEASGGIARPFEAELAGGLFPKFGNEGSCGLKWIGKPDSVTAPNENRSDHSSCRAIARAIERPYPRAMGGPPTLLFGLAPGRVCRASIITDGPVSSYLAFSTLPSAEGRRPVCFLWSFPPIARARR